MSDTPQGSDWWQGTDGKWYPPAMPAGGPSGGPVGPFPPVEKGAGQGKTIALIIGIGAVVVVLVAVGLYLVLRPKNDTASTEIVPLTPSSATSTALPSPTTTRAGRDSGSTATTRRTGANTTEARGDFDSESGELMPGVSVEGRQDVAKQICDIINSEGVDFFINAKRAFRPAGAGSDSGWEDFVPLAIKTNCPDKLDEFIEASKTSSSGR